MHSHFLTTVARKVRLSCLFQFHVTNYYYLVRIYHDDVTVFLCTTKDSTSEVFSGVTYL